MQAERGSAAHRRNGVGSRNAGRAGRRRGQAGDLDRPVCEARARLPGGVCPRDGEPELREQRGWRRSDREETRPRRFVTLCVMERLFTTEHRFRKPQEELGGGQWGLEGRRGRWREGIRHR